MTLIIIFLSGVAKRIYQKRLSLSVAKDGLSCMKKLVGDGRDHHNSKLANSLLIAVDVSDNKDVDTIVIDDKTTEIAPTVSNDTLVEICNEFDVSTSEHGVEKTHAAITCTNSFTRCNSAPETFTTSVTPSSISSSVEQNEVPSCDIVQSIIPMDTESKSMSDVEVKREEVERGMEVTSKLLRFTPEEDTALRQAIKDYGLGRWAKILKDPKYQFHASRKRDTLRMRAETLKIGKKRNTRSNEKKTVDDALNKLNVNIDNLKLKK